MTLQDVIVETFGEQMCNRHLASQACTYPDVWPAFHSDGEWALSQVF